MDARRAIIFANGVLTDPATSRRMLEPSDYLIAADGGTRHIRSLGLLPDIVIGDLDSLIQEEKCALVEAKVPFLEHPRDKDETDLELALSYAAAGGFTPIVVIAALGGRLDQVLGNILLIADPRFAKLPVYLDDGVEEVRACHDLASIHGTPGDLVSLLPWGGNVKGVTTEGLKWELKNETLEAHRTRGISNQMTKHATQIEIESGILLIVHQRRLA